MIGVISLVGDHCFGLEPLNQLVRLGDVVALTWAEQQADRIAERIGGGMDLGTQAAS
jgi:hypothetical protein